MMLLGTRWYHAMPYMVGVFRNLATLRVEKQQDGIPLTSRSLFNHHLEAVCLHFWKLSWRMKIGAESWVVEHRRHEVGCRLDG